MLRWLHADRAARLTVIGLATLLCSLPAWSQQAPPADVLAVRIADLNARLETLTSFVPDAPGVTQLLAERGGLLRDLMGTDPQHAAELRLAAPLAARIRAASPQAGIEEEGDWAGSLAVLIEDAFSARRSRHRYVLHAPGEDLEVFFASGAAPASSARLAIHGIRLEGRIAAMRISPELPPDGDVAAAVAAAPGPECSTLGVQDTAVILVTTPSEPVFSAGFTPSYFQQEFFGASSGSLATASLNSVVQEMSHGQASVAGQVFGPFALAQDYNCDQFSALLSAAIAAADSSINFTSYRRIVVVFPVSTCSYGGLGTIGCRAQSTSDGSVIASVSWLPISHGDETQLALGVFAHEFGHNLGLHHADSDDYGNVPLGRLGITGLSEEYEDRFSIMGLSRSFSGQPIAGQFASPHKSLALRWLGPGAYQEVQSSGAFTVVPFENSSGLRALRILRDPATSSWLWLEYRQPLGDIDSTLALVQTTNIFQGALIHYEDALIEPTRSNLLDFTPSSIPNNFRDPTLTPGNFWSDPDSLLRIAVTGANSSGVSVNVTYAAACATLGASSTSFTELGGSGTITVTAPSDCSWTASSAFSWLTLTGATFGQGDGTVTFTVAPNGASDQRNGYITVQRQAIPFVQQGGGRTVISVNPRQGSGASGEFTFIVKDASAYQNIGSVVIAFSDLYEFSPNTCMLLVSTSGTASLRDDSGRAFVSGGINLQVPGASKANSQCTVFSTGSSVVGSGPQLTITLQLAFAQSFSGTHRIIGRVSGVADVIPLGMWTVSSGCGYALGSTGQNFTSAAGTGSVSVLAAAGCAWAAASNATWINVTSGSPGTGNGPVGYSVDANASVSPRVGTMTIAGQTFTVQQSGSGSCSYTLSPPSATFNPPGGNGSVAVVTTAGCAWTATSNTSWLVVTSGSSGNGNGSVGYSVSVNATAGLRTGTLTIGGQPFTVQQSGGGSCSYALGSNNATLGAAGGAGTVAVVAGAGCSWTAASNAPWLTVTSGSSGNGHGTVGYFVSSLTALTSRTTTLEIAGLPFTVEQDPALGGSIGQIASGGTWKTTLTYLNLGSVASGASMSFFGNDGNPLNLPLTFPQTPLVGDTTTAVLTRTLNPGAQLVVDSTGPDSAPTMEGWGQLQPTVGIKAFGIFSNPTYKWEAVVPLESRDAGSYMLAFDNTGVITTGVALANLVGSAASVPVIIRGPGGNAVFSGQIALPARGHTAFMLVDRYPATANARGVIEFQTPVGGRISALGLRVNGPALTTLPVLTPTTSGGGSITHALFNGEWTNSFTLVNTGNTSASATLSFFDQNGSALTVPLSLPQSGESLSANSLTRTLAAGASLLIETVGQASVPVVVGSARLTTNGSVDAFGIFRWTQFSQEASVPLEQREAGSYVLPFDNTSGLTTGLALANVANVGAGVNVVIRNDAGTLLQSAVINLPANGQTSFVLPDQYPSAAGKRGTIEFITPPGGRISVIGLRAGTAGNLTTIPVLAK